MRISKLLEIAPMLYLNGIFVHLLSSPGIGKSDVVKYAVREAIANALNKPGFVISMPPALTSLESCDVRGFTVPVKGEDGRMYTKSTISPLMPAPELGADGIVFLDEYRQGSPDVVKPTSPFVLDGEIGEDKLSDGWAVWAASNFMEDRAGTFKPPMHIVNRELSINLEFNGEDWEKYILKNKPKVHPLFLAYNRFAPGEISQPVPKQADPFCTPRSYTRCAELLWDLTGGHVDEALSDRESSIGAVAMELASGMIGKAQAGSMLAFTRVAADLPTWASVQADPKAAAAKLPAGRLDIVHASLMMVMYNVDHDTVEPVFEFVENMPKEFQTATIKQMLDKLGGSALNHPRFRAWIKENPALVAGSFV